MLQRGEVPVDFFRITSNDRSRAQSLSETVFHRKGATYPLTGSNGDANRYGIGGQNITKRQEYELFFQSDRLDPADNELSPATAVAISRELDLSSRDAFLDLGSSRGGLTLTVAATTDCGICSGVELSPTSLAVARESRRLFYENSLQPEDNSRLRFFQGDLRSAPLVDHNVFYCAIRGASSRPRIMHQFMKALAREGTSARDGSALHMARPGLKSFMDRPRRLICAGFGLDVSGRPYDGHVRLTRARVLLKSLDETGGREAPNCITLEDAEPLYGDGKGPRVLLEYEIRL